MALCFRALQAAILAITLAGCASGSLHHISSSTELTKELPKDLQQKFDVKEIVPTEVKPNSKITISTQPAEKPKKLKQKRKGKKAPITQPQPEPSSTPSLQSSGQKTLFYRRPEKDPIWVSEKQVFEITYFGVAGGEFTLDVLPFKYINERKVYHIRGRAISSALFSLFYRLNDMVETFLDYDGLYSHRFHLTLDETKQTRDSLELNDSEKQQTYYWNRWHHKDKGYVEIKEYKPIQAHSQDTLSALYYLRTLPLPIGSVFEIPVVSEGKTWEAIITVVRREMMDSPLGRIQTVVVKPETRFQGVLQKRGDSFIWLTDDDRRFVVRLEAKVKIGTVVATLKKVEPGLPSGQ